jgi:CBS domain-containing protein
MKTIKAIIAERAVVTATRSMVVAEAARLMAANHIGALPVVDENGLVGIFTERDVVFRIVAANRDPATTPLSEVMSTQLVVADVEESYELCLRRMQEAHVRHLIILQGQQLLGILSFRDLMAVDLDEKADAISLLSAYVQM